MIRLFNRVIKGKHWRIIGNLNQKLLAHCNIVVDPPERYISMVA